MKKLLLPVLFAALLMPVMVAAQSVFDGTWKLDVSTAQMPKKPDVYLLQNGVYECKTCVPPVKVKADGTDQAVSGHPYYDMAAIRVVDANTIEETDKRSGVVVATSRTVVSSDGKTANFQFSDSSATNGGPPVTGKGEMTQVEKGPAGSHAISGGWRTTKMDNVSDNGLFVSYKTDGDSFSMDTRTGQSYMAKLDGTDAPYKGDPGTTSVSVKRVNKNTIEETDKRDGKTISVARMTVEPDGKTMKIDIADKLHGTTSSFTAMKQ